MAQAEPIHPTLLSPEVRTLQKLAGADWSTNYISTDLTVTRRVRWIVWRIVTYIISFEFLEMSDPFEDIKWINVARAIEDFLDNHPELLTNPMLTPSFETLSEKLQVMRKKSFNSHCFQAQDSMETCIKYLGPIEEKESDIPLLDTKHCVLSFVHCAVGPVRNSYPIKWHYKSVEQRDIDLMLTYAKLLEHRILEEEVPEKYSKNQIEMLALLLTAKQLVDYPSIRNCHLESLRKLKEQLTGDPSLPKHSELAKHLQKQSNTYYIKCPLNVFFSLALGMTIIEFNKMEVAILELIEWNTHIKSIQ